MPDRARRGHARTWRRIFIWRFLRSAKIPGNKQYGLAQIPKVVGGINPASGRAAVALYAQIVSKVVPVSSTRAAEMVKLLENIFRCVNIALVNELKQLSLRMDLDIWEVIDSAATKPFGFMPFYPGPGLGGHCIPVDPYYLSWKAREYDFATRFIELAGEINTAMPYHVVDALVSALNEPRKKRERLEDAAAGRGLQERCGRLARIAFAEAAGVVERARGGAGLQRSLFSGAAQNAALRFFPHESVELSPERLASYDCVLIATDHSSYDYEAIVRNSKLVVDTRNATRHVKQHREKVVQC